MGGHEARMMVMRNAYKILAEKPQENRQLVRLKRRREYNIKTDYMNRIKMVGMFVHFRPL
jgi:hypothetical protein